MQKSDLASAGPRWRARKNNNNNDNGDLRGLVFGFLTAAEALGCARLVCRSWSRTKADWHEVTSVRALLSAVRPRALILEPRRPQEVQRLLELELGPAACFSLESLDLRGANGHVDLDGVLTMCSWPRLEALWLPSKIKAAKFAQRAVHVPGLPQRLKVLGLGERRSHSEVSDRVLEFIPAFSRLERLELPHRLMTELGFSRLGAAPCLQHLSLSSAIVCHRLPVLALRSLDLSFTRVTAHDTAATFFNSLCCLTSLECLNLLNARWLALVCAADWPFFSNLGKLTTLDLSDIEIDEAAYSALRSLESLRDLAIDGTGPVRLGLLSGHPTLERISLARCWLQDLDLAPLASLPRLECVNLRRAHFELDTTPLLVRGVTVVQ
jgi:hypothetical protein